MKDCRNCEQMVGVKIPFFVVILFSLILVTLPVSRAVPQTCNIENRNVIDNQIPIDHRYVPDGDWRTIICPENNLYVKFRPNYLSHGQNALTHFQKAIPDVKEELPYSFSMDVVEIYVYENESKKAGTGLAGAESGRETATIHMPSQELYHHGVGDEEYQTLMTHEWAGVIDWAILFRQEHEKGYTGSIPSWFTQGYEQLIADDFTDGRDRILDFIEESNIPHPANYPYELGTWAVYYLQLRFGRETPKKLLTAEASTFQEAFKNITGISVEKFINNFESWMVSKVTSSEMMEVETTGGDYKIPLLKENAKYNLITSAKPSSGGSIKLNPQGGSYKKTTEVTVSAEPAAGYEFNQWSGGLSGKSKTKTITLDSNTSITAHFTKTIQVSNLQDQISNLENKLTKLYSLLENKEKKISTLQENIASLKSQL